MKIAPIYTNLYFQKQIKGNHNKNKNKTNTTTNERPKSLFMPTSQMVLAFCGGKSLDLAQTVQQLDSHGQFPPDIKEMCLEELSRNKDTKKTLIDIHKEKYANLYDCNSIEEVRSLFPEFKDVLGDNEVKFREDSFINNVKKGNIPYFEKDKDVSLQLLQMYWAGGLSLTELNNEFAGQNVYRTFEKFNIPRLEKVYGHYLFLSDPIKNDRFASMIREKNKHRVHNDKNHTKRSPLTEAHKAKISESLKKYYDEHPEMAFQISERSKAYFEENPEKKEIFSQVLLRAWSYPEAKSVRKALIKHMKRREITNQEIIELSTETNNPDLKTFWNKNKWARNQFSLAMTKSWERQKLLKKFDMIYEPVVTIPLTSKSQNEELKQALGSDYEKIKDFQVTYLPDERETKSTLTQEMQESQRITGDYYKQHTEKSKYVADLKFCSILSSMTEIHKTLKDSDIKANNDFNVLMEAANNLPKGANDLTATFVKLISFCHENGHEDWVKIFLSSTERVDKEIRHSKFNMQKIIQSFMTFSNKYGYNF